MWSRLGFGAIVAGLFALSGCTEPPSVVVRSLQESGDVTAVCAAVDGTGRPLAECPDFERGERTLLALVTQTMADEVAVVRLVTAPSPISTTARWSISIRRRLATPSRASRDVRATS